jgi:type II secretory pathway pseudopilin PulG
MNTMRSESQSSRPRTGMTLVEVIVALLILTGVLLVLGAFSAKFAQATAQARLVIDANEIAGKRLDAMRTQSSYASVDTLASSIGRPLGDTIVADQTKFVRLSTISHVGGPKTTDSTDYKVMTVTVSHPAMRQIVKKTSALAAF